METDFEDVVQVWEKKFQEDQLTPECFKEYWKQCVPQVYKVANTGEGVPRNIIDEEKSRQLLFGPLARFFYSTDASICHEELKKLESSSTACGHVFRYGESTYTCRDCAVDSTCVLCVDCFKYSVHRNHRYKMGSSSGGGCCDCGDIEGWKSDPWCEIHKSKEEDAAEGAAAKPAEPDVKTDQFSPLDILDQQMVKRMEVVFNAACWYAFDILTYYNYQIIPEGLNPQSSIMPELVDDDLDPANTYCTILYNDESHTYEQVTNAVVRVITCPHKTAMELVTQVDRDGRALIKYADFQTCFQVHEEVQRYLTRFGHTPLKTLILHVTTVAHQSFALDLLAWMEERVKTYKALRLIFSQVAMKISRGTRSSILEGIMMRDSRMWKFARMQWNHLFFNGLLLEYQTKKLFAKILTQNYGLILKDFMSDDHDHSFSIVSLSVQVYTVPSLALNLIEQDEVLYMLLNTFYSECVRLCNIDMKLVLGRNPHVQQFKRSHYVLYDLRYLLSQKPTTWNNSLRRSFLHGFSMFLKVLTLMQGMEAFTRCLYEHTEYEQEWESAFYLHCKMAFVISLMHEWCGEDRVVLIKAYKATLKKIQENPLPETDSPQRQHTVAGHTAMCHEYDVSRKQVSIHIPLTRLLAALHLHLQKFDLQFEGPELDFSPRPNIRQVLEPVLRQQVLIAQVHANMWRRNGMNLPNQLQWYANSKCRNEMLDCDIVMLQTAASIMEPNQFIITLLARFNLINWAQDDYCHELQGPEDDSLRQVITLAEEMLGLLITILGERYMPGVGQVTPEDCLCHEIVQQLCIKPMMHSELNHCLHKDFNQETGLEGVVDIVADLKEQTQGKKHYELKQERYAEFNLFFYHFTREDRSKAEENQRKLRKQAKELECCPPPLPPAFTTAYRRVARLLHCDVMFAMVENILSRTLNLRNSCFSELQLQETLYLMGFALLEEERKLKVAKTKNPPVEVKCRFSTRAEEAKIFPDMLEALLKCPRIEAQGQVPFITWVLGKYRQVQRLRDASCEQPQEEAAQPSTSTAQDEEAAKKAKESRSEWVAKHRAKTLEHMKAMQANFMKENAQMMASVEAEMKAEEDSPALSAEEIIGPAVAVGSQRAVPAPIETRFTCILCQASEVIGAPEARPMVMAALVQESTVLCRKREKPGRFNNHDDDEFSPMPCAAVPSMCLTPNLGPAPHTSSCGHKMHTDCFDKYYESAVAKESRRSFRRMAPPFDVERQEFMCPLCNNLSNSALPVIQPVESFMPCPELQTRVDITLEDWITILHNLSSMVIYPAETSMTTCYFNPDTYRHVYNTPTLDDFKWKLSDELRSKVLHLFPKEKQVSVNSLGWKVWSFVERFTNSVFHASTGRDFLNEDVERLGYLWQSVAYTVHAMEWIQRDEGRALLGQFTARQEEMLRALLLTAAVHPAQMQQNLNNTIDSEGEQGSSLFPGSNHYGLTVNLALGMIRTILHLGLNHEKLYPCILEWDSVGIVVSLAMSMPYLFMDKEQPTMSLPACDAKDSCTLQLVLLAHMTSLLISVMTSDEMSCPMDVDDIQDIEMTEEEGEEALVILKCIYQRFQVGEMPGWITPAWIWHKLTKDCMPFLRCCAILFRYLSGVIPPERLTVPGGDTFKELCTFLGLPSTCKELLGQEAVLPLVKNWIAGKRIEDFMKTKNFIKGPIEVNELVTLPKDFMDLINSVSIFTCPLTQEESRNPTMCLVCGEMVCLQSYCCQAKVKTLTLGPSMYHAYQCGAGVGLFLRIRECEAIVLNSPHRGCFVTPPYVDKYGETDEGLRRGNPLYLCPKSYKELQTQWLSHSLSQAIGRNYDEMNHRHLAYQWRAL